MHWFKIDKARRDLGYNPVNIPIEETVAWFRDRGYGSNRATAMTAGRHSGIKHGRWKDFLSEWALSMFLITMVMACVPSMLALYTNK
jgi:hypothetical protein